MHLLLQRIELQVLPRRRLVLLARVGPRVGVVDVEHERRTARPDALREGDDILQILRRAVVLVEVRIGIDEQADAKEVAAVIAQDPQRIGRLAAIAKDPAGLLDLRQHGNVAADQERARWLARHEHGWGKHRDQEDSGTSDVHW